VRVRLPVRRPPRQSHASQWTSFGAQVSTLHVPLSLLYASSLVQQFVLWPTRQDRVGPGLTFRFATGKHFVGTCRQHLFLQHVPFLMLAQPSVLCRWRCSLPHRRGAPGRLPLAAGFALQRHGVAVINCNTGIAACSAVGQA
jgi:hypothetical protein